MITAQRWCDCERAGAEARRAAGSARRHLAPVVPAGLGPAEATAFAHGWKAENRRLLDFAQAGLLDSTPAWAG